MSRDTVQLPRRGQGEMGHGQAGDGLSRASNATPSSSDPVPWATGSLFKVSGRK